MPSSCWPTLSSTTRACTRRRSRSVTSTASCALKSDQPISAPRTARAISRASHSVVNWRAKRASLSKDAAGIAGAGAGGSPAGDMPPAGAAGRARKSSGSESAADPVSAPLMSCARRGAIGEPSFRRGRAQRPAPRRRASARRPRRRTGPDSCKGHRQRSAVEVKAGGPSRCAGMAPAMLDGFTVRKSVQGRKAPFCCRCRFVSSRPPPARERSSPG